MTDRKYNNNSGYSTLSNNLDNLYHIYTSSSKKPRILKLLKQGKQELFIAQPNIKKHSIEFNTIQYIKHFYQLSDSQYKLLSIKARSLDLRIIQVIESRLDVLLFRLQFASSIFQARDFIKQGIVSINMEKCLDKNTIVKLGSQISINPIKITKNKLKFASCEYNPIIGANYLLTNKFNSAIFVKYPEINSINLPLNLDITKLPGAI